MQGGPPADALLRSDTSLKQRLCRKPPEVKLPHSGVRVLLTPVTASRETVSLPDAHMTEARKIARFQGYGYRHDCPRPPGRRIAATFHCTEYISRRTYGYPPAGGGKSPSKSSRFLKLATLALHSPALSTPPLPHLRRSSPVPPWWGGEGSHGDIR
jgi:hypothetical protein